MQFPARVCCAGAMEYLISISIQLGVEMPEYLHIIRQFSLCPLFLLIMFAFSYIVS